jgi:hypothetical protein
MIDVNKQNFTDKKATYLIIYVINFAGTIKITLPSTSTLYLTSSFQPKDNFKNLTNIFTKEIEQEISFKKDYQFTNFENFLMNIKLQTFLIFQQKI